MAHQHTSADREEYANEPEAPAVYHNYRKLFQLIQSTGNKKSGSVKQPGTDKTLINNICRCPDCVQSSVYRPPSVPIADVFKWHFNFAMFSMFSFTIGWITTSRSLS